MLRYHLGQVLFLNEDDNDYDDDEYIYLLYLGVFPVFLFLFIKPING